MLGSGSVDFSAPGRRKNTTSRPPPLARGSEAAAVRRAALYHADGTAPYTQRARGPKPAGSLIPALESYAGGYAVKELPQPQPPVAFGLLKVKPAPIIVVT